jgi:methylated-DNA-[protein]-cysteine S-methyltransferase
VPRPDLADLIAREDHAALVDAARQRIGRVLRHLTSRLYTEDYAEKMRVVRALGAVFASADAVDRRRAVDTLRRFFWALNDESGAVPYGMPEAIGEILAVRPDHQAEFLPVLCSMLTHEDMVQTGPIEQGVIWALGRVGPPVAEISPQAVQGLAHTARHHDDPETRRMAADALAKVQPPAVHELG